MLNPANQTDIDSYIKSFPEDVQAILAQIRAEIKKIVPSAQELINYGIPTFKLGGVNFVHFAAFKKHIGLYPTPSVIFAFQKELVAYKQAKGSVQFPLDKPLPMKLIRKMVKFRLKEIKASAK